MSVSVSADITDVPFVLVEVTPPVDAETVTVWRTAGGREWRVRGLIGVPADGAATQDYEAPTGWESSYRAEYFDPDGVFLTWSSPDTVTLPANAGSYAWVHNPLDPTTSVRVVLRDDVANQLVRPVDLQKFQIPGRSVGVAIFGTRRGVTGVVLNCESETLEEADRFDALFGGYDDTIVPILCWRTNPATRLPPTLFAAIASPQQIPYTRLGRTFVDWQLTADEVAPPAEALITALLSYEDFTVFYASIGDGDYDEFTAAYTDYTEASRDYSIAGTA